MAVRPRTWLSAVCFAFFFLSTVGAQTESIRYLGFYSESTDNGFLAVAAGRQMVCRFAPGIEVPAMVVGDMVEFVAVADGNQFIVSEIINHGLVQDEARLAEVVAGYEQRYLADRGLQQ